VFQNHHYTSTPEQTVQKVLRAGTDVDCGSFVPQHAQSALQQGLINEGDLDTRLSFLFRVRMRLGHFDPAGPLQRVPRETICSAYAKSLARDGLVQSATLIKNNGTLPLDRNSHPTVAVIGPNSKLSQAMAGYYGPGNVCDNNFWTIIDSINQYGKTTYAPGTSSVLSNDMSLIPAAVSTAQQADYVILAVGTDLSWAAEGRDAESIVFNDGQRQLILQVAAASKRPVIVVTFTATPLDLTELLAHPKVGAILHVGQPAVQTLGIGDLIFGLKVPAGRTVQTILPASYAAQISIFDFNMRPGPSVWPRPDCNLQPPTRCPMGTNPGRTYRFYTGKAVVPFGFGLSYTTFNYKLQQVPTSVSLAKVREALAKTTAEKRFLPELALISQPLTTYTVNITNTGNYDADDVVLGFVTPPGAGNNGVPLKNLYGFERVHVGKGQSVTVTLNPTLRDFTQVDEDGNRYAHPGEYTFEFGVQETQAFGQGFTVHKVVAQ